MNTVKNNILKLLSYFDIFNHPLTKEEILNLYNGDNKSFDSGLNELINEGKCFQKNGYYSINENISGLIKIREKKEKEAEIYLAKLPSYARIIKSFPFVRGIAISGSLSKNVMHDDGDIDYFIITAPNRLWICRTMLIFFKKVFLLNSRKYFCVNYFVDENNLEIPDKNVFTAMEITYLAPVYNKSLIDNLKKVNNWTQSYFSNFNHPLQLDVFEKDNILKKKSELFFKGKIGDRIDLFLMKITYNRWSKKFKDFNPEKFELTMRTNRGISKHHPLDFQNRVLKEFNIRLNKLEVN